MFNYVEVSKNTYPYRTLHLDTCGSVKRALYPHPLTHDDLVKLDSVRIDICTKCMPENRDPDAKFGDRYHPALRNFWAVQQAFKDEQSKQWAKVHAVRKLVALEIAIEEARAAVDLTDERTKDLYDEYSRTGRDGDYRLPEVTVGRR